VVARRVFGEYWFENIMALFGTYTGVAATGAALKTCDPEVSPMRLKCTPPALPSPMGPWRRVLTSMTP
jgi:hypothetical protein